MNLERRAQLEAAGVDVGQALARMMGSEAPPCAPHWSAASRRRRPPPPTG